MNSLLKQRLTGTTYSMLWSRRSVSAKAKAKKRTDATKEETQPGFVDRTPTKSRMTAVLDPVVADLFDAGLDYGEQPGRRKLPQIELPAFLELAAKRCVSQHLNQQFRNDAVRMARRVYHLELPPEPEDQVVKQRLVIEKVIGSEPNVDFTVMTDEEKQFFMNKRQKKIDRLLAIDQCTWRDIEYTPYASAVYLASRLAPNYASLVQIFHEIKKTDPSFSPKTLFDFGSGIGTTMFAAHHVWPHKISENFNVDICKSMNELSAVLMRGGQDNQPMLYSGVYHREYLPLSSSIKYDLVVAAHTLMELPSRNARVNAIESLWQKTGDLLVIAETGTKPGFSVVLEARNLVLQMSGYDVTKSYYNRPVGETAVENYDPSNAPSCHILAPCPHHYSCPRMDTGGPVLCNNVVTYKPFDMGQRNLQAAKERFAYVVLRKGGKKAGETPNWPRINQKVLRKSGHAICRMCCPDGGQKSVTITKSKHKGHLYKCAKMAAWGDLLPVTVFEEERPLTFWDKMKQQAKEQSHQQELSSSDSDSSDSSDDEAVDPPKHH